MASRGFIKLGVIVHTLSDSLQISFFPLWRADSKISGFAGELAGCVWREEIPGKKKLRVQKYPDTGGRGHVITESSKFLSSLSKLQHVIYRVGTFTRTIK